MVGRSSLARRGIAVSEVVCRLSLRAVIVELFGAQDDLEPERYRMVRGVWDLVLFRPEGEGRTFLSNLSP